MAAKRVTVELERVGKTATMFRVPFDLKEAFGRARPPVKVTIRGHEWRTTPGVYDGVGYIVVNRSVKAATGVDAGDRVAVAMELDTAPRTVRAPADLRAALDDDEAAAKAFRADVVHAPARVRGLDRGSQAAGDARTARRSDRRARARRQAATLSALLRGTLAASVTPLRDAGAELDEDAFEPLVDFFVDAGLDGILALGTAGRGSCSRSGSGGSSPTSSSRPQRDGSRSRSSAARSRPPRR